MVLNANINMLFWNTTYVYDQKASFFYIPIPNQQFE